MISKLKQLILDTVRTKEYVAMEDDFHRRMTVQTKQIEDAADILEWNQLNAEREPTEMEKIVTLGRLARIIVALQDLKANKGKAKGAKISITLESPNGQHSHYGIDCQHGAPCRSLLKDCENTSNTDNVASHLIKEVMVTSLLPLFEHQYATLKQRWNVTSPHIIRYAPLTTPLSLKETADE